MIIFEIATPERIVYKDIVDSLTLPTREGEITVLPHHIPLVSVLVPGAITVRKGNEESYMAVSGGFIEVQPSYAKATEGNPSTRVVVLADTAERAEELTVEAIEKARAEAQRVLAEKRTTDVESFTAAAAALERELARLKVARRHRPRGGPVISSAETEQES